MRPHIFPILLAAIVISGAVVSGPSAERFGEPDQIDLVSLRSEAMSAMHQLQVSQERRLASLQVEEF
jgi:hypothetical protein